LQSLHIFFAGINAVGPFENNLYERIGDNNVANKCSLDNFIFIIILIDYNSLLSFPSFEKRKLVDEWIFDETEKKSSMMTTETNF